MHASFSELLRRHRLSTELTQEALAERAGLSVNGIQKLESGGTRPQRETERGRVARALQLVGATCGHTKSATGRMYILKEQVTLQLLDMARQMLGTEAYEQAWNDGCALSLDQAIAVVRQELSD